MDRENLEAINYFVLLHHLKIFPMISKWIIVDVKY